MWNFDENVPASEPRINQFEVNWREQVRKDSIDAIQNPENASDQVEQISNDYGSNDNNDELEQESMDFTKIITMLDKRNQSLVFDDEDQDMLSKITKNIEELQLKNRK